MGRTIDFEATQRGMNGAIWGSESPLPTDSRHHLRSRAIGREAGGLALRPASRREPPGRPALDERTRDTAGIATLLIRQRSGRPARRRYDRCGHT